MKFTPKTAEQIEKEQTSFAPFPNGEYDFEFEDATDEVSQSSGNDMIKLKVNIYNAEGSRRVVFDYLTTGKAEYKLRHCAEACGLLADYENGSIEAEQFIGHSGKCKVRAVPAKDGYPAKNDIQDYIVKPNAVKVVLKQTEPESDIIPF